MPVVITPPNCEKCGQALQANYQDRRLAWMPWRGRILLITSIILTLLALPGILVLGAWAIEASARVLGVTLDPRRPLDRVCLCMLPTAVLPGLIGWWYGTRLPRLMQVPCRKCGYVRVCSIRETEGAPEEHLAPVPGSTATAYAVDYAYTADKLERAKKRKRRAAARAPHEAPNPDFDFDKPDGLQSEPYPPEQKPPDAGASDAIEPH